ncbi:ubiquinone biosynthesis O-methyltransferase [Oxobacter pfennigii]|uniref:Ubiquinone biosynthesis O-methyltransferase n=1 Tax=Oxobacter pfennigii TaxID=36849 RepID=A0A0P8W5P4_9CLOT|nr:class I SAM-dependent methyltransferase [Oxobacter pfennigii]KPU44006.1 ubiquinone biosynthesis O-methyltransferase [Oxobacter pfennigii]
MSKIDNGLTAWETNATFWDERMGDDSNDFHRNLVRPYTEELLDICQGELVLDIACGNGNFSERLAECGAKVVAFDYSAKMIELAKKRRADVLDRVNFYVCDATNYDELLALGQDKLFDKAVANMAIMDISDINPLFKAVHLMMRTGGSFVFATHHPCFTYPNNNYFTSQIYQGEAIAGQPVLQNYYHRSIQEILNTAFLYNFVLSGFYEVPFPGQEIPIIMIVRLDKK